jgi:hypothetical protein
MLDPSSASRAEAGKTAFLDKPEQRGRGRSSSRSIKRRAEGTSTGWFTKTRDVDQGRLGGDHHRRASPL